MRARLNGTWGRYFYNGDRVLEETNDANGTLARYTTESGSYYEPLLHFGRNDGSVRYPLYDGIGTARRLADAAGSLTDSYTLDTFGRQISVTGTTPNPYRFGGAWGYITDPSGMLQLGARYYWPEVGRFGQRDPAGKEPSAYLYARGNPVGWADPKGKEAGGVPPSPCAPDDCDKNSRCRARCMEDWLDSTNDCYNTFMVGWWACLLTGGWVLPCELAVFAGDALCQRAAERDYDKCRKRCDEDYPCP